MGRCYRWLFPFLFALFALASTAGSAWALPRVERISFAPRADGGGYVVRIHTSERLTAYSEPRYVAAHRLELILFNTELSAAAQRDQPGGPVQGYTVRHRDGHLYLQFELDERLQVQADAYRDRATDDMILGLSYQATTPSQPVAHNEGPPMRPVRVEPSQPALARPPATPAPLDDARARWRLDTIVIDAGHGGHDAGAIGAGGVREKDVVLPVALRVGHYLETLLGVRVVYTRDDDRFITLANRGHIANEAGGKLFISIHANAARNTSAQGAETYFLGLHKTAAARKVMERENSVIRYEEDAGVYDGLDQQALIEQNLAQSAYLRTSEQLADLIQHQFADRVNRTDRGVKQAGFYVLWSASMPSILVELGFVTNPTEAAFLADETGQDYLASAIFRAVRDFKAQYEKGLDLVIRP